MKIEIPLSLVKYWDVSAADTCKQQKMFCFSQQEGRGEGDLINFATGILKFVVSSSCIIIVNKIEQNLNS